MTGRRTSMGRALFAPVRDGLRGTVRVPGDKSISHRAVLLGAVNDGAVSVSGFLGSADTMATVQAVRALGVAVEEHADTLTVHGNGWTGLREPDQVIDVGNSGTLMRLLPGLVDLIESGDIQSPVSISIIDGTKSTLQENSSVFPEYWVPVNLSGVEKLLSP